MKKYLSFVIIVFAVTTIVSAATVFNPNQTLDPGATDPSCTLATCFIQASTSNISTGTVVNATLRWNGTAWVENTSFLVNGGNSTSTNSTTTNSWISNILGALTAVFTNLTATNGTITNSTSTNFSTTIFTSGATSTFNGKVILNSAVQDSSGATGTANQVLTSTGTSTKWITMPGSLSNGTATNTTLRWNGSAWVENTSFLADGTGNATWTNSTSTQIFSTNASITNSTSTNLFAVLLNAITGYITNLYSTNATITNATSSNIAVNNLIATSTLGVGTTTNIYGGALTAGATINNALVIASSTNLSTSTYALYNVNGALYWNGESVASPLVASTSTTTPQINLASSASTSALILTKNVTGGTTWTARSAAEANIWYSVTYGNGLFVAVSITGTNRVMTSPDGITWTARSAAEANFWTSVTYGNGLFVAVANTGTNRVMTSPDGITWTARSAAAANPWFSVTYGNGQFVAVATSGANQVMTSPDGITWTARTASAANQWRSVVYGNGIYVAVGSTGVNRVMTSPDGITWTSRTEPSSSALYSVAYGNGKYVAVANSGTDRVIYSTDGINWTSVNVAANTWNSITYGNGLFVATALDGANRVIISQDGITWTPQTHAEANSWQAVTYGNNQFVAVSADGTNRVMSSPVNPTSVFTAQTIGNQNTLYVGTTGMVGIGTSSLISALTIAGGITATGISNLATTTFNGKVTFNSAIQDSFGATGTANQILTSTGTSTKWVSLSTGAIASGTATNSTLRWDGTNWVENTGFQTNGGNATWTNSTSTQIFSTNASITNSTSTNLFAVLLNAITGYITNLYSTNATITNATSSNIAVNNLIATSTLGVGTTTNIYGGALTAGATINNALVIASSTNLSTSTYALYNVNGALYWNGSALGGGSASGAAGAIQLSNGAGGFVSTTTFNYATSTNILTFGPLSNIIRIFASTTDAVTNNLFIGQGSGNTASANSGQENTAFGATTMSSNTTGSNNVAVGKNALNANTTANYNTAIGSNVLELNITGAANVGVGAYALSQSTSTGHNTALGTSALWQLVSGDYNSAVGDGALGAMASGSDNVAIGQSSGTGLTSGNRNIFIGMGASTQSSNISNFLNIGNSFFGKNLATNTPGMNIAGFGIGTSTNIYGDDLVAGLTVGGTDIAGTRIANVLQLFAATGTANVSTTTYALYNVNGQLYWNGSAVGGSATMPFSGLTAATGTNTLDNTNLAQVWNWSTATSATALTLKASSLSGGTLLKLDSGSTGMGNGSSLLSIDTSVATTGTALSISNNGLITSNLVNIQGGGTGNVLALNSAGNTASSTGNMLSIAITGSTNREQGLKITNAGNGLSLDIAGAIAFGGTSYDPASNYANNANLGNANLVSVISSVAPFYGITGITDLLGTAVVHKNGRILYVTNGSTTAAFTLYNESASSTAANRILTGTGADLTIDPNATVQLIYDSFSSRWKVVGGSGGGSISVQTLSASTTLTSWNQTVYVNTSAGNVVLTLPTAVGYTGKNITIKKTTNDTNWVSVVPTSGQYIDNASTTVTLTSYLSAATVQSDGSNPKLVSDIGAVGAEYGENTAITHNGTLSLTGSTVVDVPGSSFTLPSAGTWEVDYSLFTTTSVAGQNYGFFIRDNSNSIVVNSSSEYYNALGSSGTNLTTHTGNKVIITTSGSATYKLSGIGGGGTFTVTVYNAVASNSQTSGNSKITWKKISGYQPVIGQMVDYAYAEAPSGQSIVTTNTVINFASNVQGNIPSSSGSFTLTAGKTYSLSAVVGVAGNGDYAYYRWYDVTNSTFIGSVGTGGNLASLSGVSRNAEAVYTPNSNVTVQVRVSSTGSGSPVTSNDADDINGGHYASAVKIIQLGTTAMTGVSLSVITNAVANGSLDNTNYTQTWDWSTATSTNALALSANSLTTGSLLNLSTLSSNLNGTNGLVNIQATNATSSKLFTIGTSTAGNVLSVFANGLVGIGTTSPSATLSLAGNIFASSTATSTFLGGGINLVSSSGNIPCFAIDGVCLTNNSSYQWATTTNNMIYYSQGNVGVGTSSPYANSKLTIAIPTDTFTQPAIVGGADAGGLSNSGTEAITTVQSVIVGSYMYTIQSADTSACSATASSANGCEFKIFDISSTTNPVYLGGGDIGGTTNSGTNGNAAPTAILVYGSYAYITVGNPTTLANCSTTTGNPISNCNLQVWNISNPASPTYVMGAEDDGTVNGGTGLDIDFNGIEISSDGNYIFTSQDAEFAIGACTQTVGNADACEFKVWRSMEQGGLSFYAGYDSAGFSKTADTGTINLGYMKRNGAALYIGSTTGGGNCSASGGGECDLRVVSIADPDNVITLGGVSACGTSCSVTSTVNEIAFNGSTAYIVRSNNATACSATNASRQGCELQIYNVANVASMTFLHGLDAGGARNTGSQNASMTGIKLIGDYLYVSKTGNATACSNTVGSAVGCELMVFGATSTPYYAYGYDISGTQGSGTGVVSAMGLEEFGSYILLNNSTNATACSNVAGSAIGCEYQIYQVGSDGSLGGYALSVIGRAVGTSWESFSDRNLKENILDLGDDNLQKILELNPTTYNFKGNSKMRYGFIAQEVQEVMPELVSENNGILSMDYMGLIAPTVKAIQDLNNKIFAGSTSTAINIEELTASSTISVDTKLKALGTNMEEVNKLLAGLNDLNATSSTVSTSTITHVTTTISNSSCSVNSQIGNELNGGIIKSIIVSTSTIEINGILPPPTATCEVATYSTTTEEKVEMSFVGKIFARITTWLADSTNGITNIFAKNLNAEEKICLGQVGNQVCMTKDQLERILQNSGTVPVPTPAPQPESGSESEPQPAPETVNEQGGEEGGQQPVITPESTQEPVSPEPQPATEPTNN